MDHDATLGSAFQFETNNHDEWILFVPILLYYILCLLLLRKVISFHFLPSVITMEVEFTLYRSKTMFF